MTTTGQVSIKSGKVYQLIMGSSAFTCHCGSSRFVGAVRVSDSSTAGKYDFKCSKCGFMYTAFPSAGTAVGG